MSQLNCPLGEDCDMTLAWMMGAERAKDTIKAQAAEIEKLREALRDIIADSFSLYAIDVARAALAGAEKEEGNG